jgi:hypothetical protein
MWDRQTITVVHTFTGDVKWGGGVGSHSQLPIQRVLGSYLGIVGKRVMHLEPTEWRNSSTPLCNLTPCQKLNKLPKLPKLLTIQTSQYSTNKHTRR